VKRCCFGVAWVVLTSACAVDVEGAFDDISFAPVGTVVALADRHDYVDNAGAKRPVKRGYGAMTASVLLTNADVDADDNWRDIASTERSDCTLSIAREDGIVVEGLSVARLNDGESLQASVDHDGARGDFSFAIAQSPPSSDVATALGARIDVVVRGAVDVASPPGRLSLQIEVRRSRDVGQPPSDIAAGEVIINVDVGATPERLAEHNLSVARPVLLCAMREGPLTSALCRRELPDAIVDESGTH
jgi:hypothetical protein